jgi:magnesium chelatase family protein
MIKVQSLIQDKQGLQPVEVELTLWPGLPGIQFLGLPDQHLKESGMRIKSAIKSAGFQFPVAQQILVNLRPSHLKKTSRGLELAVAAAYLWESGQLKAPLQSADFFIYGELGLSGDVLEPEDLPSSFLQAHPVVLTGKGLETAQAPFRRQVITHLKDLNQPQERPGLASQVSAMNRPWDLLNRHFSLRQARLIEILAVGEHSCLLAGPAGSGKSTLAQCLPGFLRELSNDEFLSLQKIHREFGVKLDWRPVVKPHHTTPMMAMVGGGSVPFAGEITKAHGGVLILDELLEFSPTVQEALREPFEEGKMRVYRNGHLREYPARAQILATTNLCPCGKWTPLQAKEKSCILSNYRCTSYSRRLSGPLVDRFEMIEFTESIGNLEVPGHALFERIQRAQKFSQVQAGPSLQPNSRKSLEQIMTTSPVASASYANFDEQTSQRRKLAVMRVARTLADLDLSEKIQAHHLDEAVTRSQIYFQKLTSWGV